MSWQQEYAERCEAEYIDPLEGVSEKQVLYAHRIRAYVLRDAIPCWTCRNLRFTTRNRSASWWIRRYAREVSGELPRP